MSIEAMLMAAGAKDNAVAAEDVFSTTLYTGNGSTQTINNGIDLAGEGGLVWVKRRNSAQDHYLADTVRGIHYKLSSNLTNAQSVDGTIDLPSNDGFRVAASGSISINNTGDTYASWTFRQAPKFFDIVQYTGDGVAGRQIAHDLGVVPGMVIVKRLSSVSNWFVYHRGNTANPETDYLQLNGSGSTVDDVTAWNDASPTDSFFTVGTLNNPSGVDLIAYLFAHDPSDSGIIQCGSYVGNGSTTGPAIDLGWEPQYVLIKNATDAGEWTISDNKRDTTNPVEAGLAANSSAAENNNAIFAIDFIQNGFQIKNNFVFMNTSGETYIYCAIKAPE